MAFSEIERRRVEKAVGSFVERRRPPVHIRPKLDLDFEVAGQSVLIFEVGPDWQDASMKPRDSVAKATYVRRADEWRIYWERADLRWHRYKPRPTVHSIEEFLRVVDVDAHSCFFE